jgi:hypothetical protein
MAVLPEYALSRAESKAASLLLVSVEVPPHDRSIAEVTRITRLGVFIAKKRYENFTVFVADSGDVMVQLNKALPLEPQQIKIRYLLNHHYEYENDEKTGYSGVPGCHGSNADGESHALHP